MLPSPIPDKRDIAASIAAVDDATTRLSAVVDTVRDGGPDAFTAPSLLPEWSIGHIVTHLARNADGFRNLLIWARTGAETPMYPSEESRDRDIEAGARRSAAELAALPAEY